jgi:hypothetical protein
MGRWEEAIYWSLEADRASPKMKNLLCSTWYFIREETPGDADQQAALARIEAELDCNFP